MNELGLIEPIAGYEPSLECGPAPQLAWIKVADLRIDRRYQRDVTRVGKANIRRIAEGFRWARFAPVVISPIEGGLYAIVDGQHRTTAAASIGLKAVPCQIILADVAEQADAFRAINGQVTRVSSLSVHRAAVMAGDAAAVRIDRVARGAGATILTYPVPLLQQKPGQTMALGTIGKAISMFGEEATTLALRGALLPPNDVAGGLTATIIGAGAQVCALALSVGWGGADILERFAATKLIREEDLARRDKKRDQSHTAALADRLRRKWGLE